MAAVHPDIFYLLQRSELLSDLLRQKERELEESRAESGRLRLQLQERDQHILELEGRLNNNNINEEPARKRARSQLYNTRLPWSSLRPSSLNEKKAALRTKFLEPCFEKLPKNVVKANVTFRTDDGFTVGVEWPKGPLDRNGQPPPADQAVTGRGYRHQTDETRDLVRWCVYFKDQASLSDVWFHELHMKFMKVIPPLSWLQEEKREQNNFIPYQMEENARDGNAASRSVKGIIEKHLMMPKNRDLLEGDEPEVGFRYGLDGRPQAKNNIIGAVMACITPVRNPEQALARPKRTVREEYCVFLYSGKEDYEEQVRCGSRVFREIEELHLNGIDIDLGEEGRKHVKIKWYVLSDWKALAIMLGLVGPTGDYFCISCYCRKAEIAQFRQDYALRSQESAHIHTGSRDSRGHQHLPLIGWSIDQNHTDALEKAMKEVGIRTFYIRKEATREGPSTFKWKSLTGKELETAIQRLPDKLPAIINNIGSSGEVQIDSLQGRQLTAMLQAKGVERVPRLISERKALLKRLLGGAETVAQPGRGEDGVEIRVEDVQKLWKDFTVVMEMVKDPQQRHHVGRVAKQWCEDFRDITYQEDVTPYIHYLGCHLGTKLTEHPFMHSINCEMIEKKNHVQTRRFHHATQRGGGRYPSKWAEQLMQMENRETFASIHGIGQRQKRSWVRRNGQAPNPDPLPSSDDEEDDDDDRIAYNGEEDDD
ncbi:hypothetical protein Bbelb_157870 [Branchiostoma belcheri]|nr:hypothetical protein Bbelb_157870 [Branchiostoma belcheri]